MNAVVELTITSSIQATLFSGVNVAFIPPMSVFTHPGCIACQREKSLHKHWSQIGNLNIITSYTMVLMLRLNKSRHSDRVTMLRAALLDLNDQKYIYIKLALLTFA